MKGLWLEDSRIELRRELERPVPPSGEALVRVKLAGICNTDLELQKGYFQFRGIPGHEFVGFIEDAPDQPQRRGERVVGEINAVCSQCEFCRKGLKNHCANRTVLGIYNRNGCFAEYLTLPLENLLVVPDSVPDEAAVFTEPVAAALRIREQLLLNPSSRIVLIGAGKLGQLIAQTLKQVTTRLTVVARYPAQRTLLENAGIKTLAESECPQSVADIVVEATGSPGGFKLACKAVRPGGTIVLKSTYSRNQEVDFSQLVVDEITLVGSRCGPFSPALSMLQTTQVDPLPLISKAFDLEEIVHAFDYAGQTGVLKVLVTLS